MGYTPTFFGVDGMDGILTMDGFDASLAEGVMLLTPLQRRRHRRGHRQLRDQVPGALRRNPQPVCRRRL